jgi:hypothetical protein
VNPSFHDAIKEIADVRPQCSSVSRAVLSWPFWCCGLNLLALSLVMISLAFSITLVISSDQLSAVIYVRPTTDDSEVG